MAANVTIQHKAFADSRFDCLAQLAGLADADHARGKMARLWSMCTELQTDRPPLAIIRGCLGPAGEHHLVESELGEQVADGLVRVRGCEGAIEWFGELRSQQQRAGKARASNAPRNERGQLVKAAAPLEPAQASALDQPASGAGPAQASALGPAGSPGRQRKPAVAQRSPASESEPTSGTADSRGSGSGSAVSSPSQPPELGRPGERVRPPPTQLTDAITTLHELARPTPAVAPCAAPGEAFADPALIARRQLGDRAWERLNARRAELADELGLDAPQHLPYDSEGRRELANRLRASGAQAERHLEHVFAMAEAEARASRSLRYFGGSMFGAKAWEAKLTRQPSDVRPAERNVFAEVDAATAAIERAIAEGKEP
jgi:hypothetical protein